MSCNCEPTQYLRKMLKIYLVSLSFLLFATDVVRCKPEYLYYYEAEGWLKLHRTPVTWEEAFVSCHDEGAVLASPLTKGLVNTLVTIQNQADVYGNILVGTHALFSEGDYVSVEGVPLSSMEVTVGTYGEGSCMSMNDARVYYTSCTKPLSYVCYKKIENRTMNECGTFDDKYQLNQKTGSCYKVHQEKLSWARAYRVCASEGGHLVVVNDDEEAAVIKDFFSPRTDKSDPWERFYVGLAAWGKDRVWISILGDSIANVYNKWNPGQPDNFEGIQNRGAILANGNLDDVSVDGIKLQFVCEKSPKAKIYEGTPPCGENLMKLCRVCKEAQTAALPCQSKRLLQCFGLAGQSLPLFSSRRTDVSRVFAILFRHYIDDY